MSYKWSQTAGNLWTLSPEKGLSAPADFITSSYMALLPLWLSSKVKE
jgi:hypothetical protein